VIEVEKDKRSGRVILARLDEEGMVKILGASPEELQEWSKTFPQKDGVWVFGETPEGAQKEISDGRKKIALLRTNMTEKSVSNVAEAGLLDAYAALAEDCPDGITAHVWRSYGAIVFLQVKQNEKIGPHELALRAKLEKLVPGGKVEPDTETAAKHIRLLLAKGLLRDEGERWGHEGLPLFFQS
jgi:hypothetical protein